MCMCLITGLMVCTIKCITLVFLFVIKGHVWDAGARDGVAVGSGRRASLDGARAMAIRDKIFRAAKGMRGRAKSCVKIARNRVEKAWQYQYRDRRNKKRDWRALWITRINAATREHGVKYGEFINALARENVCVDRKILAELAVNEPHSFKALVDRVRFMRGHDA